MSLIPTLKKTVCWERNDYKIEKDIWPLIVKEVETTYDDKENNLIYNGHTLPEILMIAFVN